MRGGSPPLEDVNLLDLAPIRLASWREENEIVVLERPRPNAKGLRKLLEWFQFYSAVRTIRLDDLGGFAWRRLDGSQTVGEIAEEMRTQFGETAEPAEERLGQFIQTMRREGLLAYPGWDAIGGETTP